MTADQKKYRSELDECDEQLTENPDSAEWETYRNELWAMEDTDGVVFRKQFEEPGRDVSNWPAKP